MGFYEELSRWYDEIFPVSAAEMAFTAAQIAQARHVLDLGCGTGNKTVHLALADREITALDLDEGMIVRARQDNARPGITYTAMDMREAGSRFSPQSFDAMLCLGNTLVHLDGPMAIGAFFRSLHPLLVPGGPFLIQILNYDRILDTAAAHLPPLESDHVLFTRRYEAEGDRLHFITALTLKETGQTWENDVLLYPLRKVELRRCLQDAGFAEPAWHGSFAGGEHTPDSFVTIAVCRA